MIRGPTPAVCGTIMRRWCGWGLTHYLVLWRGLIMERAGRSDARDPILSVHTREASKSFKELVQRRVASDAAR